MSLTILLGHHFFLWWWKLSWIQNWKSTKDSCSGNRSLMCEINALMKGTYILIWNCCFDSGCTSISHYASEFSKSASNVFILGPVDAHNSSSASIVRETREWSYDNQCMMTAKHNLNERQLAKHHISCKVRPQNCTFLQHCWVQQQEHHLFPQPLDSNWHRQQEILWQASESIIIRQPPCIWWLLQF